jgi:hypothetical protein
MFADTIEAGIVAVGGGAQKLVVGARSVEKINGQVQEAEEGIKVGKAPGLDGVVTECLNGGGITTVEWLGGT